MGDVVWPRVSQDFRQEVDMWRVIDTRCTSASTAAIRESGDVTSVVPADNAGWNRERMSVLESSEQLTPAQRAHPKYQDRRSLAEHHKAKSEDVGEFHGGARPASPGIARVERTLIVGA